MGVEMQTMATQQQNRRRGMTSPLAHDLACEV